jgi:Fe-S-cluster-containing dehydrogenase component
MNPVVPLLHDGVERRDFLRLMSASLALGGLGACTRQPTERIYPSARSPESRIPGKPLFFATAMPMTGGAQPILVESHMGRPTKIEGNPLHPGGFAATTAQVQAAVLGLYDPDRSKVVKHDGRISTWPAFLGALREALDGLDDKGTGLRILTETVLSPSLADQLWALTGDKPGVVWHQYEPVNRDTARAGATLAFGEDVLAIPRFENADVVLAIDSDFMTTGPASVKLARDFAARRRAHVEDAQFCRLYAVESAPSPTGSLADHRLALSPARIDAYVRVVARAVGVDIEAPELDSLPPEQRAWTRALIADLKAKSGRSVVTVGDCQAPAVQALAHAMNVALGSPGTTVDYYDAIELEPIDQGESLRQLADDMEASEVKALVILGGNPAYSAPADLAFGERMAKVPFCAHLSLHEDETSQRCGWHVPEAHFLESWTDTGTYDATASIVQPLIAPLYEGRSSHEILAALAGFVGKSSYEIVRAYWKRESYTDDFDALWAKSLHDGWLADTAFEPRSVSLNSDLKSSLGAPATTPDGGDVEVVLRPDPMVWDGRFANNGWLQELPRPITSLTWDNAALISPATARRLGVEREELVELKCGERTVEVAVLPVPGHADDCVTLHLGYGRTDAGELGSNLGCDAFSLVTSAAVWSTSGRLRGTGRHTSLARTQKHHDMEGRDIVRSEDVAELSSAEAEHHHTQGHTQEHTLLEPQEPNDGPAWGMVIDLSTCMGCNACIIGCQSENNIPIVGKQEVIHGREMHWIRVDSYFEGDESSPQILHQPVPCMHCENAPCEVVCPVGATVHSTEGLNDMVYNRCVGTRYCEANCPYKVRRFNFYLYADYETPSLKMLSNPDVTVRSRGVMEKCTYCVQRINEARITAKKEGREIRGGEVVTACQSVCPSSAIAFGDLNDPESEVSRLRNLPQHYSLLEELGVRPRTTYLSKVTTKNPEVEEA